MRTAVVFGVLATSMVGCNMVVAEETPSFTQLGEQIAASLSPENLQAFQSISGPLSQLAGVQNPINLQASPLEILGTLMGYLGRINDVFDHFDKSVKDIGVENFKKNTNDVTDVFIKGLLGHFNADGKYNSAADEMAMYVNSAMNQTADMIATDFKGFEDAFGDLLISGASMMGLPGFMDIIQLLQDVQAFMHPESQEKVRMLTESFRVLAEPSADIPTFDWLKPPGSCKIEPKIRAIVNILTFVTSDDLVTLLEDLQELFHSYGNLEMETWADLCKAIEDFCQSEVIGAVGGLMLLMDQKICKDCDIEPALTLASVFGEQKVMTPSDLIRAIFLGIEHFLSVLAIALRALPGEITRDIFQTIADLASSLIMNDKGKALAAIAKDIEKLVDPDNQELANVLEAVATFLPGLEDICMILVNILTDFKNILINLLAATKYVVFE